MNARKLGQPKKAVSLKAPKQVAAARKASKKVLKTVDVKPRKKLAKPVGADSGQNTVAAKPDEIKPREIARLEPVSMSKVLRSGPRDVKNVTMAKALPVNAAHVQIAPAEPVSMSLVLRSGPRGVKDVTMVEALPVSGAGDVQIAPAEPVSMSLVLRSGPREMKNVTMVEALPASGIGDAQITRSEPVSMSLVLRSGRREVNINASEARIVETISETAPYYGVPTWFALRIAEVESGFNPYARGRAGEIGLYQLKCPTARGMGFAGDCSDLTNARINVRWGLKHLSLAIALSGGNLKLAASKHNAGLARKSLVYSYISKVF